MRKKVFKIGVAEIQQNATKRVKGVAQKQKATACENLDLTLKETF